MNEFIATKKANNINIITKIEQKTQFPLDNKNRYLSIDVFRGLAISAMIFVNTLARFDNTPTWSKHAVDFGLTYVDLVAPFFIFAIALTYKMSFNKGIEKEGHLQTYVKNARRYAAFIGFEMLGSLYITRDGIGFDWGVLQAIGFAGLFTLFFIKLPKVYRYVVAIILIETYQYVIGLSVQVDGISIAISDLGYADGHGGLIGGFGYGGMMLLSTAIIDDFRETSNNKIEILIFGFIFMSLGIILHVFWLSFGYPVFGGISKLRVTHSYIFVSIGIACIVFWLFWFIYDHKCLTKSKSYFFEPQGKNAFLLYIIQPLFLTLSSLYLKENAHIALVLFSGLLNVVALWLIGFLLNKKKIYVII